MIDVGCGTAEFLSHLVSAGHIGRLAGVDTSQSAVEAASRIEGVEGIRAAAEEIPVADGACGVITARHMLYHLGQPLRGSWNSAASSAPAAGCGSGSLVALVPCVFPLLEAKVLSFF
ncbi:class I SAM-dependent methyltransferase [Nocardia sp. NPDC023852]|uniref:class I SAM-dependent methyltransferase n=1 Tax=Nocardia sp. NPDC023852 TaxID=3154697 RepID=UPI0033D3493F